MYQLEMRSGSLTTCGEKLPSRRHNASTSSYIPGAPWRQRSTNLSPASRLMVIGAEESDAKLSYFSQRGAFGKANRLLVPPQDFECFAPEGFAGGRELHCAPVPEEQTRSKFLFRSRMG